MPIGFKSQFIMGMLLVLPDLLPFRVFEITKHSDSDATLQSLYITDVPAAVCNETSSGGRAKVLYKTTSVSIRILPKSHFCM